MRADRLSQLRKRAFPALALGAAALALPGTALAVSSVVLAPMAEKTSGFAAANVDPSLASKATQRFTASRETMRFTPAGGDDAVERRVNVAVRLDDKTARAISVRNAIDSAAKPGKRSVEVAASEYDMGIARGYQSFAKPASKLPPGVSSIQMPDLSLYRPDTGHADKPSRFQPRISLEQERPAGRAPRTIEGMAEQSVDLGGSYRIVGNLNVTAGVRLSQERDRLTPLTDGAADNQSVYVGTQLRF
ncbi:hypothetical protein MKP08_04320 [Erythrobacter sp. LQ02-29]|uniref:hypothetical protein n=1 Tax=Erythrobacter sp. LQ02-29 TaxID=2920384 RepID=UPI001F4E1930|nr:hypothetical protein [Erythrobacter sp. LQ02-29]MCP9221972.1 hypothetical protein [Erythrobacter sp. LQ02-29]